MGSYSKRLATCLIALSALSSLPVGLPQAGAAEKRFTLYTQIQPPLVTQTSGGIGGIAVEIVTELFEQAELPYSITLAPWRRAYVSTLNQPDSCIFPVQRTQEREAQLHWISPILVSEIGAYVAVARPPAQPLKTLADLKPLRVGSHRGSATAEYLERMGIAVDLVNDDLDNFRRLTAGRIDAWAADTRVVLGLLDKQERQALRLAMVYFTVLRALACNLETDDSDIQKLRQSLSRLYAEGSLQALPPEPQP